MQTVCIPFFFPGGHKEHKVPGVNSVFFVAFVSLGYYPKRRCHFSCPTKNNAPFIPSLQCMELIQSSLQTFQTSRHKLAVYVPEPAAVREHYKQHPADFPYWSQIWPAALGLCEFLEMNPGYLENKMVLELAAGLGLPSFLAAHYSKWVHCSDYLPEAVALQQKTIAYNQFSNMSCSELDWNSIPDTVKADVLLLSDVNYDPWVFEKVFNTITRFLQEGTLIILSTPQRLMAKPFIERVLPFCVRQDEVVADKDGRKIPVTIMILKQGTSLPA
jgi:predicted nicotinamide N-methyase